MDGGWGEGRPSRPPDVGITSVDSGGSTLSSPQDVSLSSSRAAGLVTLSGRKLISFSTSPERPCPRGHRPTLDARGREVRVRNDGLPVNPELLSLSNSRGPGAALMEALTHHEGNRLFFKKKNCTPASFFAKPRSSCCFFIFETKINE